MLSSSLSKLWFPPPPSLLAADLSIRGGESQGVIHDSLIDEDFNLIWFVNFNYPQSAFCAVFCNTRPQKRRAKEEEEKKLVFSLNNGISQFLRINKIPLQRSVQAPGQPRHCWTSTVFLHSEFTFIQYSFFFLLLLDSSEATCVQREIRFLNAFL